MVPKMEITAEDLDDELQVIFIEETFHKSEPIRSKPIQTIIPRVVIKNRRKTIKVNGVSVKVEPPPKKSTNDRFSEFLVRRRQAGVMFETDLGDGDEEVDDDDDDQFEDCGQSRTFRSKVTQNLAKKIKNKAIANRLGIAYNPSKRLKNMKPRREMKAKSWVEKFGRLLAAKKLLYLPLLLKKYNTGPFKSKEELDIEIDLYMAEVSKCKKLRLAYSQITDAAAGIGSANNGISLLKKGTLGGFGGPGWRKRLAKQEKNKDELDMEIDDYMASKGSKMKTEVTAPLLKGQKTSAVGKEELDMDLDQYMASAKKSDNSSLLVNGTNGH